MNMINKGIGLENSSIVRRQAEKLLLQRQLKSAVPTTEVETLSLVQELEVHQIELELIVEELKVQN